MSTVTEESNSEYQNGEDHSDEETTARSDDDEEIPNRTQCIPVPDFIMTYNPQLLDHRRMEIDFEKIRSWNNAYIERVDSSFAKTKENRTKNRYPDIIPYDYNRVPLNGLEFHHEDSDDHNSRKTEGGYINASYIRGFGSRRSRYIATQGPLPGTSADFWGMVWQEGSQQIIMLTRLSDGPKVKCHQYYPSELGEQMEYDEITVSLKHIQKYAYYDLREFILTKGGCSRSVRHYFYHQWPDMGVPSSPRPILDLLGKVFRGRRETANPVVIHCSAGVGRTGTFISIDYLLSQAAQMARVDVARCVYELRRQRVSMCETVPQYVFIHEAVHEALEARRTTLDLDQYEKWYSTHRCTTALQTQYELMRDKCPDSEENEGCLLENIPKNRDPDIIPDDKRRPRLLSPSGDLDADSFINAVLVDMFTKSAPVIVTQYPLESTTDTFWKMVYEYRCGTIVLLEPEYTCCPKYWPGDDEDIIDNGVIRVHRTGQNEDSGTVTSTTFSLTTFQNPENIVEVKLLHMNTWPKGHTVPPDPLDLLSMVKLWLMTRTETSVIQCCDGYEKSGLFCACAYLVDQIQADHQADIYHTCRMITSSRPSFISSQVQFEFLHDFVKLYLEEHR